MYIESEKWGWVGWHIQFGLHSFVAVWSQDSTLPFGAKFSHPYWDTDFEIVLLYIPVCCDN